MLALNDLNRICNSHNINLEFPLSAQCEIEIKTTVESYTVKINTGKIKERNE